MKKTVLLVVVTSLIAGAVVASVFLQSRKASATAAQASAMISPFALHRRLGADRLPVDDVVDYTYVFPER
jgi:hypothetical protein